MKKLIISLAFTITLPLFQVAIAQGTEITATFSDTDITDLQLNVCNNSEVNGILSSNEPYETALDDTLVQQPDSNYYVLSAKSNDYVLSDSLVAVSLDDDNDYDDDGYEDWDDDDDGIYTTKTFSPTSIDTSIVADPVDPSSQDAVNTACL